jgi:hypothetical protein
LSPATRFSFSHIAPAIHYQKLAGVTTTSRLRIDLKNGKVDTIRFDSTAADHRTRIQFSRM